MQYWVIMLMGTITTLYYIIVTQCCFSLQINADYIVLILSCVIECKTVEQCKYIHVYKMYIYSYRTKLIYILLIN